MKECCSSSQETQKSKAEFHQHHEDNHAHEHSGEHEHAHVEDGGLLKLFTPAIISFILLIIALTLSNWWKQSWFTGWVEISVYILAYIPVGLPVLKEAWMSIKNGDIFSEFLLMGIATVGAFAIGQFPEAVAVMLFYSIGEAFQSMAVSRAKLNIKSLLDQRPDTVTVLVNHIPKNIPAKDAKVGDIVQLKPGEKLGLDGILINEMASFNTAALTGESKPDTKLKDDIVLAGMINLNTFSLVKITTPYEDSKLSKILTLVQDATAKKAPTELFIRKFAKIYTPIIVLLAVLICVVPFFIVDHYIFHDWLYRALIFLVISCPCALVISIPLGYFGGIGAASKNGILFKGSNFLDKIASIQNVVMDKTGTLTHGVFKVQELHFEPGIDQNKILQLVNALEAKSTHPVATAIHEYVGDIDYSIQLENIEEIHAYGLKATIDGDELLVGNFKLIDKFQIPYQVDTKNIVDTVIAIAYQKKYIGYITISDQIKDNAAETIHDLHQIGVKTAMLSGDKDAVVQNVANKVEIETAFGDLLPEDKVEKVRAIKAKNETVAFVGDGVNDAPVVALSDVGIAMGGLGSDATIETADIVIQDDNPIKIPMAIKIGRATKKIVWQNIALAFGVKAIVLILGAGGLATMWEAVFADVGVALLAILNAVRIQKQKF
ncbi:MAG: cadmium-translocating P-type ATPase [Chitinophagaceae bacterium]|nr:MAG: cadmium-translocating P-type ATPase [Chitinophagaceae bacterium]